MEWLGIGLLGLMVGALANRSARRLALEKSVWWPFWTECERCFQPMPWYGHLPVLGFFLMLGHCRHCGQPIRWRQPVIELAAAALCLYLYSIYFSSEMRLRPFPQLTLSYDSNRLQALFIYHLIFIFWIAVAALIDWDWMIIPDSVTVTGMLTALVLGTFWYVELHPLPLWIPNVTNTHIPETFWQHWSTSWFPVDWRDELDYHWHMNWNRYLGFCTGLMGLVMGGGLVWVIRWICSTIMGREALGFGDVTLMAMIGAFVGWQLSIIIFFFSAAPASLLAIGNFLLYAFRLPHRALDHMPFGPHISLSALICLLMWKEIWAELSLPFDNLQFIALLGGIMFLLLALSTFLVNRTKQMILRLWYAGQQPQLEA